MDPFIHNLSCVMICKGTLFYWYSEVTILHVWAFLTFGLSLLVTFNYYPKKKKTIHYPTLPAKTSCSIPSTHLQGFRNYIATILESYLGGMSIILSGLLWWHSVASVFHCDDLFLHWSSYFPGVNCWSHSIFYGAKMTFKPCDLLRSKVSKARQDFSTPPKGLHESVYVLWCHKPKSLLPLV